MGWNDRVYILPPLINQEQRLETVTQLVASGLINIKNVDKLLNAKSIDELDKLIQEIKDIQSGKDLSKLDLSLTKSDKNENWQTFKLPPGYEWNGSFVYKACKHKPVNISLMHIKLVCSLCNKDLPPDYCSNEVKKEHL